MSLRTLVLVLAFGAVLSAVFLLWPGIDPWVSDRFYRPGEGFWLRDLTAFEVIRDIVEVTIWGGAALLLGAFVAKMVRPLRPPPVDLRAALFLLAALALGPGLVVNVVFKDNWGRPRPVHVEPLAGPAMAFQPVWVIGSQCDVNCSFVSGEAAAGFVLLAFVPLVRRRRLAAGLAVAWGAVVGAVRVIQGGHYLSDVIFAGIITFVVIWALHRVLYVWAPPVLTGPALERGCVALRDWIAGWRDELWLRQRMRQRQ